MAGNGTITAANAVFMLSVQDLFAAPQQLKGFAADDVFDSEPVEKAETSMGVDGVFSAGYIFKEVPQNVTLQADSPSNDVFEEWVRAQDAAGEVFFADGSIRQPSIGKVYTLTRGVLMRYPSFADAKKILQPRKYTITWGNISPSVL